MTTAPRITAFPLRRGRAHEVYGAGAVGFAMMSCAQVAGTILWIGPQWQRDRINPDGFASYADPARLLLAHADSQDKILQIAEEGLRNDALSLVIMELDRPLTLTAGRRLQLAAEAGETVGLSIVSKRALNNTAETRWHCEPVYDPQDSTCQQWCLKKNKSGTLGTWNVRWDAKARRIRVVSKVIE